ncbi:hypothetical protein CERSUDRAFT_126838 [Gelatoporia subvermispora B]|uniref:DUF6534 domain-containing protein n=1 Tax=Ceriporiopsis subvermispora (strain B) TaxID=914234 RepID=M2Q6L3_CERS8|nr:hypothetical protein CERSUDRAFT_126838 [Gelatoporia subvermispora B]
MISLDGTLGVLQIVPPGTMITFTARRLYGVTMIQTYVYFRHCERDPTLFKIVVGILWILDTLHQAMIGHAVYTYTVTDFSSVLLLTHETWSLIATIVLTASMELTVRGMFCLRIWQFSGKKWVLVAVIMLCSLGAFGTLIAFAMEDRFKLHDQFLKLRSLSAEFYIAVGFSISADALIAVSQVLLLQQHRSSFPRTQSILRSLIIFSVNTGILTTLCVLLLCITWASMPSNLVYDIFFAAMPTLLLNALLATLNARQELRETTGDNAEMQSIFLSATTPSDTTWNTHTGASVHDHIEMAHLPVMIKIEQVQRTV